MIKILFLFIFTNFLCFSMLSQACSAPIAGGKIVNGITNDSIQICVGATVNFENFGSIAQSGFSISNYTWHFGDGITSSGANSNHIYLVPGRYFVNLIVRDNNSSSLCESSNDIGLEILVSTPPSFSGFQSDTLLCAGQTLNVTAIPNNYESTWSNVHQNNIITNGCMPDNFTNTVNLPQVGFVSGATITSINQIESICLELEHSYIADISIRLFCPNGQNVRLHNHQGGGTDFGIANGGTNINCANQQNFGTPFNYCFTPNATLTTANSPTTNGSLNAGDLASFEPLSNLIGCPLNGLWYIELEDNANGDDGNLTVFGLNVDPTLLAVQVQNQTVTNGCILDNVLNQNFTILQNSFVFGSTITNVNQIEGICLELEHTYAGDLKIEVVCPNGQNAVLHNYIGAGNDFGIGSDDNCSVASGTSYNYCFTPTATVLVGAAPVNAGSFVSGNYSATAGLSSLIGCPANGNWTIRISDNANGDDGKLFTFNLNLTDNFSPISDQSFTPQIGASADSSFWTIPAGWAGALSNQNNTIAITPRIGAANVTYTVTNNFGCTFEESFVLYVVPNPILTISSGIACIGEGYVITASGASTYGFPNNSAYVTPTTTTNYTITGTDLNGCTSSETSTVTVVPLPIITITSSDSLLCVGQFATLTGVGGSTYLWNPGGIGSNILVSPSSNQLYTIQGKDSNGCVGQGSFTQTMQECASLNEIEAAEIELFPNPAQNTIWIRSDLMIENIQIKDAFGKLLYESNFDNFVTNNSEINTEKLPNGSYFMIIKSNEIIQTKIIKFVILR